MIVRCLEGNDFFEGVEGIRPEVQRTATERLDPLELSQRMLGSRADRSAQPPVHRLRGADVSRSERAVLALIADEVVDHEHRAPEERVDDAYRVVRIHRERAAPHRSDQRSDELLKHHEQDVSQGPWRRTQPERASQLHDIQTHVAHALSDVTRIELDAAIHHSAKEVEDENARHSRRGTPPRVLQPPFVHPRLLVPALARPPR